MVARPLTRSGVDGEPLAQVRVELLCVPFFEMIDAVDFTRVLSGRAEGPGILRHKLPL